MSLTLQDNLTGMFDNYTFTLPTPDGTASIFISENSNGTIYRVDMTIGKAGSSVAAWCNALSRMTTFALRYISLDDVIKELEDISSDRFQLAKGIAIRSGPEAMSIALQKYKLLRNL